MKNTIRCVFLALAISLCAASLAWAQNYVPSTVTTNSLFFDGQNFTMSAPAYIVDAGGYVRIDVPGGSMTNADTGIASILSFSFILPKDAWYALLF